MRHYNGDPYWLTCKYPATCAACSAPIRKGDRAFRYKSGKLFGEACGCGETHQADFDACAFDEAVYTGEW